MRCLFLISFLVTGSFALTPAAQANPMPREPDQKFIDSLVEKSLETWGVPGLAMVIVNDESVLFLKGYGVRSVAKKQAVTPDTIFPLASCSKAFTTSLMATLVGEGKLDWDDPVRKHLKSFTLADKFIEERVTLRDLLSHRTGVSGHDLLWYRAPWDQDEVLRRLGKVPVTGQFRSSYQYQSIMFTAAGRVITNNAEKPWHELLQDRICTPLGMKNTSFDSPTALKGEHALGHRKNAKGELEEVPWYVIKEPNAAGSINSNARDLGLWLRLHLNKGTLGDKTVVPTQPLLETHLPQMIVRLEGPAREDHPDTVQMSYAMGWLIYDYRGQKVLSHGGWIDGFRVQLTLLPEKKLGFALLNNLHGSRMNQALANNLIDHLLRLPARDWNDHYRKIQTREEEEKMLMILRRNRDQRPDIKPSAPLEKFIGTWSDDAYGDAKIRLVEGTLHLEWSTFTHALVHHKGNVFRFNDPWLGDQLVEFRISSEHPPQMRAFNVVFQKK